MRGGLGGLPVSNDRTLYRRLRAGPQSVTISRDRKPDEIVGTTGKGQESRANSDTVEQRLARLAVIIDAHDWEQLREWRLSQMAALGLFEEPNKP